MEFKIVKAVDKLGRIVLPKSMRDYYNLNENVTLTATKYGILISREDDSTKGNLKTDKQSANEK